VKVFESVDSGKELEEVAKLEILGYVSVASRGTEKAS
jgi:hypothetical protein